MTFLTLPSWQCRLSMDPTSTELRVGVHRLVSRAGQLVRATSGSSGYDLASAEDGELTILPGAVALVRTGLALELPPGLEGQVRSRSGLAARSGVFVLNSPGTIDSDYRGEMKVVLANFGGAPFSVFPGDRIAQLVFIKVPNVCLVAVDELAPTERGVMVALGPQEMRPSHWTNMLGGSDMKETLLASIAEEVVSCQKCRLGATRTKAVPGAGSAHARICFVGEGPGREEDLSGIPFVGQAGRLLDRILIAEGLSRRDFYICNIVKCRPPNNRVPEPSEVSACSLYLYAQLAIVEPEIICLLGNTALRFFFGEQYSIGQVRGTILVKDEQRFMPTYHPAAALRNPQYVQVIQSDLRKLAALIQRTVD